MSPFSKVRHCGITHDARATGRKEVKVVNMRVRPANEVTTLKHR